MTQPAEAHRKKAEEIARSVLAQFHPYHQEMSFPLANLIAQALADAVPDGYVVVPVNPTDDMINTASRTQAWSGGSMYGHATTINIGCDAAKACYRAMIAAAPKVGEV